MYLTNEEEKIYNGEYGETLEMCMNLIVSLGDIYGAEKLIDVTSAQVSGVSYKTIGEKGLEFLRDMSDSGLKVSVPTTLNPAGMDLIEYEALKFPADFAKKQLEIIDYFEKLGIELGCTCTPYLSGNVPRFRDHISWAESSAVCYSNSVLGAYTNREGGPSALASAILGKTSYYGYHLDENRIPNFKINLDLDFEKIGLKCNNKINNMASYGLIGRYVGRIVKNGIPYFNFTNENNNNSLNLKSECLKGLGAALAASGGIALYHFKGITPEAICTYDNDVINGNLKFDDEITITNDMIEEELSKFDNEQKIDLICIGCPHSGISEIKTVVDILLEEKKSLKTDLWICTSIYTKAIADRMGYTKIIEDAGGKIVVDTCMVVAPIEKMGYKYVATNSGKAATYLPNFCNSEVIYGSIEELIRKGLNQ
ncbi:aconitase X catalytic domain-containing protein [Methanococcus voltae]|uniref:Phosphomevalonate dehydratase large subunit n=1 Tax=Methanococcus voltae (strain ATCC BAA-1334 / A3) TaxID=456320 RepID=D7DUZ8_METV3|nr:aconitase X catalytic domain-containing protein [Methanococcus voltae]MCS3900762.1 putative aconitase [Methanococcus voltae]